MCHMLLSILAPSFPALNLHWVPLGCLGHRQFTQGSWASMEGGVARLPGEMSRSWPALAFGVVCVGLRVAGQGPDWLLGC